MHTQELLIQKLEASLHSDTQSAHVAARVLFLTNAGLFPCLQDASG